MEGFSFLSCFFFLFLGSASLTSASDFVEMDDYVKQQSELARQGARAAYNPDPLSITSGFNAEVHKALESNSTRRGLRGRHLAPGKCLATNPIDRCWRCRTNWANHRKRLATCAKGFGHKTTGGAAGKFYVVTDPSDDDLVNPRPGTLRWGVVQMEPLWIVFARDMVIRLSEELLVFNDKTIDGRGHNIRIANGAGITIQRVHNVIIHGIHVHDIHPSQGGMIRDSAIHYGKRTYNDGDGISLFNAYNVWIDHVSMSNCADGLIDAVQASTAITISNCHFTRHNEVMLLGASDAFHDDQIMQVTVAFNHFGQNLIQRMPRCRWGFVHVVNNDYTHWQMYAIGGSSHPTIISQGNRYVAPDKPDAKEVTHRDYATEEEFMKWTWLSQGDVMVNGAFFRAAHGTNSRKFSRQDMIKAKPGNYVRRLTRYAGALDCFPGKPC